MQITFEFKELTITGTFTAGYDTSGISNHNHPSFSDPGEPDEFEIDEIKTLDGEALPYCVQCLIEERWKGEIWQAVYKHLESLGEY